MGGVSGTVFGKLARPVGKYCARRIYDTVPGGWPTRRGGDMAEYVGDTMGGNIGGKIGGIIAKKTDIYIPLPSGPALPPSGNPFDRYDRAY